MHILKMMIRSTGEDGTFDDGMTLLLLTLI